MTVEPVSDFEHRQAAGKEPADAYALLGMLLTDLGAGRRIETTGFAHRHEQHDASLWEQLVGESDYHGATLLVEPIVAALSKRKPGAVPDNARRIFFALASRHRQIAVIPKAVSINCYPRLPPPANRCLCLSRKIMHCRH